MLRRFRDNKQLMCYIELTAVTDIKIVLGIVVLH